MGNEKRKKENEERQEVEGEGVRIEDAVDAREDRKRSNLELLENVTQRKLKEVKTVGVRKDTAQGKDAWVRG